MSFTGKATYSAGATLPEINEDVADIVSIVSPHETPLLNALGDAARPARSTVHEWLEDALLANSGAIDDSDISDPESSTTFGVASVDPFRVGDQIQVDESSEVMLVTAVDAEDGQITVVRGYGNSEPEPLSDGKLLRILGNAALEGADAATARFTTRTRRTNYTQIFTSAVEVSGSELAARQIALADEMDYQKQQRLRELLRDLENCVINGRAAAVNPQGSTDVRRTMRGIVSMIQTHVFEPGENDFPDQTTLTEAQLSHALRRVWATSNGSPDLIVVNAAQKRAINSFVANNRRFTPEGESYKDMVSVYESDFGVCRVLLTRWVPEGTVLLLDSSRISVLPLAGRSFHYKPLASTGDRECGQIIGEYTLELRNESAHAIIKGLS